MQGEATQNVGGSVSGPGREIDLNPGLHEGPANCWKSEDVKRDEETNRRRRDDVSGVPATGLGDGGV